MNLFVPLADGQSIPNRVFKSIAQQSCLMNIIPCVTNGVLKSNHSVIKGSDRLRKMESEVASRNKMIDFISDQKMTDKYAAMQDRDLVHLNDKNFEWCVDFLDKNEKVAAVSLPWKDYNIEDHIRLTATVFRVSILDKIRFRIDSRYHICATLKEDINALGMQYVFLSFNSKLVEEIQ